MFQNININLFKKEILKINIKDYKKGNKKCNQVNLQK